MAVQQRRTSKTRRDKRRSHMGLSTQLVTTCTNCSNNLIPHRVCLNCGYYRGQKVLAK